MAIKDVAEKAAAKAAKTKTANKKQKVGFFKKIARYFKDLKAEYKKIIWPSKKQVVNNTLVVIAVIVVLGIFIAALDFGLGALVKLVLGQA